jgi:predicted nucleic acid-binding Zn ribbon protein
MRCPYCGAGVEKDAIACSKCGYVLPKSAEQVRVRRANYTLSQVAILGGVVLIIGFFSTWLRGMYVSGLHIVSYSAAISNFLNGVSLGGRIGVVARLATYGVFLLLFLPLTGLLSLFALWSKRGGIWLIFVCSTISMLVLGALTGVAWYVMQKDLPVIAFGFWMTWAGLLWLWLATLVDLIVNRGRR